MIAFTWHWNFALFLFTHSPVIKEHPLFSSSVQNKEMSDIEETESLLPTINKPTHPPIDVKTTDDPSTPPLNWFNPERLSKLRLRSLDNLAIPMFYFMLGFGQKLPFVASRQYLRRVLHLSPANQGLILDVVSFNNNLFFLFLNLYIYNHKAAV